MNIQAHFDSYKTSVTKDLLAFKEAVGYAKTVGAYAKINTAFEETKRAALTEDGLTYRAWLVTHQRLMVDLLERMVSDELWDYKLFDFSVLSRMVAERGYRWFRFCKRPVEVDLVDKWKSIFTVVCIPRYTEHFLASYNHEANGTVVDALELETIGPKTLSVRRIPPVANSNTQVQDWALPLFARAA